MVPAHLLQLFHGIARLNSVVRSWGFSCLKMSNPIDIYIYITSGFQSKAKKIKGTNWTTYYHILNIIYIIMITYGLIRDTMVWLQKVLSPYLLLSRGHSPIEPFAISLPLRGTGARTEEEPFRKEMLGVPETCSCGKTIHQPNPSSFFSQDINKPWIQCLVSQLRND